MTLLAVERNAISCNERQFRVSLEQGFDGRLRLAMPCHEIDGSQILIELDLPQPLAVDVDLRANRPPTRRDPDRVGFRRRGGTLMRSGENV